jgi:hypothetical protein
MYTALLIALLVSGAGEGPAALPTPSHLSGGASSVDELVERFLAALHARDRADLDALRVSEAEYRSIIVPGSVEPGKPPQVLAEDALQYFWTEMSQKSAAHRDAILQRFGGRPLGRVRYGFEKGEHRFAGYNAYRKLVVVLRDEHGAEVEVRTGSIVERDGRFKFASFIRD